MRLAQDAHVMPVIASSTSLSGWASALDSVVMVASLRMPGAVAGVVLGAVGGVVRRSPARLDRERRGVHLPAVLEVQEQAVRRRLGERRREVDARAGRTLLRVDV